MGYLEGQVTIGPLQPVERVGVPPPTPSPAVSTARGLVVYQADTGSEAARFPLGPDCHYRVASRQVSIGWSWTGGAPKPISPTLCFGGALVCAVGALVTARDAREAAPEARSSARAAAALAVGLALVPLVLFGLVLLLFVTSNEPLF